MQQFDKVASIYAKVRPTYPEQVYQEMVKINDGHLFNSAVDIGCGSGQSTEGLVTIAHQVIGVEPGAHLLEEARSHYPNIKFYQGSGEQTNLESQMADLVTIATAFYWMDRVKTLEEINRLLRSEGVLAIYRYLFPVVEQAAAQEVINRHLTEHWDQYREDRLVRQDDSAQLIKNSGYFSLIEASKIDQIIPLTPAEYVGFLSSTSYVSRHLESLGAEAETYLATLEESLQPYVDAGKLPINFDIHLICAKR